MICTRRPTALWLLLALCVAVSRQAGALEGRSYFQVTAGAMTDNEWGELFEDWGAVTWRNNQQLGLGLGREWAVGRFGFAGIEGQVLQHFGEQTHQEFTVPVTVRTPRLRQVWLPSLAYGLGLSLATRPPETEIARTGESTELLAHWFFEAEFGNDTTRWRPYIRLHHRSHAWETFGARTGSNAVLIGLRGSGSGLFPGR